MPPKGSDWLRYVVPSRSLTADIPASSRAQMAAARRLLPECAHELSAKSQSLAMRTASSSPAAPSGRRLMHMIGPAAREAGSGMRAGAAARAAGAPKISSCMMAIPSVTSARIVGG